jgi:hypothetical protein
MNGQFKRSDLSAKWQVHGQQGQGMIDPYLERDSDR